MTPEGLDLTRAQLRGDYARARQIRSRCTLLDLAAESACLESMVGSLFEPGGFWAEAPG